MFAPFLVAQYVVEAQKVGRAACLPGASVHSLDHRPSGSMTRGAWWASLAAAALRVQPPCRVTEGRTRTQRLAAPGWRASAATVRPFLAPA